MKIILRLSMILPISLFIMTGLCLFGCSDNSLDNYTFEPQPDVMVIKDVDYYNNIVFDLGRLPLYRSRSDTLAEPEKYDFLPGDSIIRLLMYMDDMNPDPAVRLIRTPAMVYVDPEDTLSDDPELEYRVDGFVDLLDETGYYCNPTNFYVQFFSPVTGANMLAAYMEVRRTNGTIDTIGDISDVPLKLKLIRPSIHTSANHHVFEYPWRNVYWLGETNINLSKIDIRIYKGNPVDNNSVNPDDLDHQDGIGYLQILGLDQGDNFGHGIPDGEIDRVIYIDHTLGLLFFPSRHPFDSPLTYAIDPETDDPVLLNDSVPGIYLFPTHHPFQTSKYYIAITRLK